MNGIIGIADLLEDTHLDQEQQNFVHTIQQSAHTLLGLINDILDFSKIDAGKLELEHIAFDPLKIAESCVAIVAPRAYEKKLSLVCHTAPDLPRAVLGDPSRITQILLNLLNNAIKFTPQGEVVLRVECEAEEGAAVRLRFAVADTGIGIAAGQTDRLFEPFTQADASTSRHFGGTGLGLSICKRLAELMGGRIGVDSREKLGSTFWVTLPFPLAESPAPAVAPDNLPPVVWLAGGSTALRASLNTLLARWGCRVAESSLAEWSEERWAEAVDKPLLLLLEQQDRAVLLKLAKQAKSLAGNRVALVLASPDAEAAAECKAAGIACAVQPVTGKNLAELLAPPPPSSVPAPGGEAKPAISASAALDSGQLILLAEDNRVNQVVALSLLKKLGYTAHVVENGEEAVAAVSRLPYGLVLMDCQMPVMDGFSATQTIRQREIASGKHIPIVAMTANAMAGDREQCLAAGMDDYLSKPVGFAQLKQVLDAWLPQNALAAETTLPLQQPVMDWSRLRDYFDDDEAGMQEALAVFLRTLPERSGQLQAALAKQDSERCQFILNDFQASSEGIGAARLAELLRRVQADAGQKRWEALANIEALLAEQQGLLAALLPQPSPHEP
jgi:CheY-like chemotaxis protein